MVDMKLTPKEVKEEKKEMSVCGQNPPPYPWGLCIRLEKEELDKLKLAKLPNVGDEFHIMAVGRVTSVSSSLRDQRDDEQTVSIQIVSLDLAPPAAADGGKTPAAKPAVPKASTIMSKY